MSDMAWQIVLVFLLVLVVLLGVATATAVRTLGLRIDALEHHGTTDRDAGHNGHTEQP